jgi:hypothetical protein
MPPTPLKRRKNLYSRIPGFNPAVVIRNGG